VFVGVSFRDQKGLTVQITKKSYKFDKDFENPKYNLESSST